MGGSYPLFLWTTAATWALQKIPNSLGFFELPAMPTVLRFDAYRVAIYTNVIAPHTFTSSDRKGGLFSS